MLAMRFSKTKEHWENKTESEKLETATGDYGTHRAFSVEEYMVESLTDVEATEIQLLYLQKMTIVENHSTQKRK